MSPDVARRLLGPLALLAFVAVAVGLFVRADLQRSVRLASRVAAIQKGVPPQAPEPRRPAGLDRRGLSPGENLPSAPPTPAPRPQ